MTSPVERISGPKQNIDAGEAVEGENRFLYADMLELLVLQLEAGKLLAGHDARGDLGDRLADHLGDERHGARGARVDFEDVDEVVLDGELDIHQADDAERQRQFAGLAFASRR